MDELVDNTDVVYSWSTGGYLSAGGTAVAAPAILTSANCSVETETYFLNADCGTTPLAAPLDAGTWVLTAYPAPPADISTLVMVTDGACDGPMVVAIAGCEAYVNIVADAGNPAFPVAAGESGTASYTVTFVPDPAGPDCCAPAGADEVIIGGADATGNTNGDLENNAAGWTSTSSNFGTVACDNTSCGTGGGSINYGVAPNSGSWLAWFGGIGAPEIGTLETTVTIPPCPGGGTVDLTFAFENSACGDAADFIELQVDGNAEWTFNTDPNNCDPNGTINTITVSLAAYADGMPHTILFTSTSGNGADATNFTIDNIMLVTSGCAEAVACDAPVTGNYDCVGGCTASASMISTTDPTRICVDGVGDPINVDFDVTGMGGGAWVITDAAGIILALPMAPPFDLDGAGAGQCLIWYVNVDDPAFNPMVGDDAQAAVDASSCAFLSNPITVDRIEVTAPTISTTDPTTICVDGVPDPINVATDDAGIGANSAWVITDDAGIILALPPGPPFDLDGAGVGTCLIWLVNFEDPAFAPAVGADAAALVAAATCAALSNPITVVREICACEEEISYSVNAPGCDMTGAMIQLQDAAGGTVATMALGPDGGTGSFGVQVCGDYTIIIMGEPACYTDEGGDVGPRSFTTDGTGSTFQDFGVMIANIPTVGEWGLIILGLLMSITAVVGIRARREEEIYS